MKRREFITLLGGAAAVGRSRRVRSSRRMPVIGFLNAAVARAHSRHVCPRSPGLKETGYVEGQNVAIEYRWAEGHSDRLPALASRSGSVAM